MSVTVNVNLATQLFPAGTPAIASYRTTVIQNGQVVSQSDVLASDATKLAVPVENLAPGDYVCQVQALAADGTGIGRPDSCTISVPPVQVPLLVPTGVTAEVTP